MSMTGVVKWFKNDKGYGFIKKDDGSGDVFVHHTGIIGQEGYRSLAENDKVSFEIRQTDKGPQAYNVSKL